MHHLRSFLCFIFKSKLILYLEMKTNGSSSGKDWLPLSSEERDQGLSSEKLPSLGQQWNFSSQTHYKIKLIFLQLGKMWYFARKKSLFFSIEAVKIKLKLFRLLSGLWGVRIHLGWPPDRWCVPGVHVLRRQSRWEEASTAGLSAPLDYSTWPLLLNWDTGTAVHFVKEEGLSKERKWKATCWWRGKRERQVLGLQI